MLEPSYRNALVHAWHLLRQKRQLWIYGFLSIIFGQFAFSNFIGELWALADPDSFSERLSGLSAVYAPFLWQNVVFSFSGVLFFVAKIIAVICVLVIATVAQGALIHTATEWIRTKSILNLADSWRRSRKQFWPLLTINLLTKALLLVILCLVMMAMLLISSAGRAGVVGSAFVMTLGVFATLVVSAIHVYAACYVVKDRYTFAKAVRAASVLFSHHILVSLELSVLLLILNIAVVIGVFYSSVFFLIPSFFIWLLGVFYGYGILLVIGWVITLVLYVLFIGYVGSLFNVFTVSAWTYYFMKMHREGLKSRLFHHVAAFFSRK